MNIYIHDLCFLNKDSSNLKLEDQKAKIDVQVRVQISQNKFQELSNRTKEKKEWIFSKGKRWLDKTKKALEKKDLLCA